jgi:pyrimidine deaminase RibD-like protein
MFFSREEKRQFMAEALAQSRHALPACRPNPPVGCVIVCQGRVISRGFTGLPGTRHAEVAAIDALQQPEEPAALAVFVTLEPCSFQGRTPSCARALIDRGIRTIFVGMVDPDPRNRGEGLRILREAGVSVELGVLEEEIREFLGPYLVGGSAQGESVHPS